MSSILQHSRRPDITFHGNGRIDISARVARKLSLNPGDVIDISVSNGDCNLYVKYRATELIGRHEGHCYPTSVGGKGMWRTWSKRMAEAMLQLSKAEPDGCCARLACGKDVGEGENLRLPIIYLMKL